MGTLYVTDIANKRTEPRTNTPVGKDGASERVWCGQHDPAVGDLDAGDIIVIARVPTNLRLTELKVGWDDLGGTVTADLGLYEGGGAPDNVEGTVVDIDEFASALTLSTATALTDQMVEAAAANIDRVGKRLWEWAGESADPGGYYDIAFTIASSSSPAAGTIAWIIRGTLDN